MSIEIIKKYYITGACMYAMLDRPRPSKKDGQVDPNSVEYSIKVECPEETLDELYKLGVSRMTTLKEFDGDPRKYLNVKNKIGKDYVDKIPKPRVFDVDKQPIDCLIGNGSNVTVEVLIRKYVNKKGLSVITAVLGDVRVNELIPYVKEESPLGDGFPDDAVSVSVTTGKGRKAASL